MNRKDIIKMAQEAGYTTYDSKDERLEALANLVAAEKEKQIIDILRRLQERNESHNYYKYAINVIRGEA